MGTSGYCCCTNGQQNSTREIVALPPDPDRLYYSKVTYVYPHYPPNFIHQLTNNESNIISDPLIPDNCIHDNEH